MAEVSFHQAFSTVFPDTVFFPQEKSRSRETFPSIPPEQYAYVNQALERLSGAFDLFSPVISDSRAFLEASDDELQETISTGYDTVTEIVASGDVQAFPLIQSLLPIREGQVRAYMMEWFESNENKSLKEQFALKISQLTQHYLDELLSRNAEQDHEEYHKYAVSQVASMFPDVVVLFDELNDIDGPFTIVIDAFRRRPKVGLGLLAVWESQMENLSSKGKAAWILLASGLIMKLSHCPKGEIADFGFQKGAEHLDGFTQLIQRTLAAPLIGSIHEGFRDPYMVRSAEIRDVLFSSLLDLALQSDDPLMWQLVFAESFSHPDHNRALLKGLFSHIDTSQKEFTVEKARVVLTSGVFESILGLGDWERYCNRLIETGEVWDDPGFMQEIFDMVATTRSKKYSTQHISISFQGEYPLEISLSFPALTSNRLHKPVDFFRRHFGRYVDISCPSDISFLQILQDSLAFGTMWGRFGQEHISSLLTDALLAEIAVSTQTSFDWVDGRNGLASCIPRAVSLLEAIRPEKANVIAAKAKEQQESYEEEIRAQVYRTVWILHDRLAVDGMKTIPAQLAGQFKVGWPFGEEAKRIQRRNEAKKFFSETASSMEAGQPVNMKEVVETICDIAEHFWDREAKNTYEPIYTRLRFYEAIQQSIPT